MGSVGASPATAFLPFSDARTDAWRPKPLPSLDGIQTIQLDCETTGLHRFKDRPVGLALGYGDQAQYAPFGHRGGGPQHDEDTVKRWALRELRGKRIENLNTKFDIHLMESWGVPLREMGCTFHDVAHSEALLDDFNEDFTLEGVAQKRLGTGKITGLPKKGIADMPAQEVAAYAERDVKLVRHLVAVYTPLLAADELTRVSELEDAIIPVCVEMERNGLPLDMERLRRWEQESGRMLDDMQWALYRRLGFTVNPSSGDDMRRLFALVNEPVPIKRKKKKIGPGQYEWVESESFEADVLEPIAAKHEVIRDAYRITLVKNLRSKSLVKYLKDQEGGILYPDFNQLKFDRDKGAVSGRFSSSNPNGQNVQNFDKFKEKYGWLLTELQDPWVVRKLFVAGSGDMLVADQSQVEIRIAAHFAQATKLIEAYRRDPNTNPHEFTAGLIRPYAPSVTVTKTKITSFRRLYGSKVPGIAHALGISIEEGQELVDAYDKAFPEWQTFLDKAESVARTRGFVRTILKRRARFDNRREGTRFYSAANRICQGTGGDVLKLTLVDVYAQRKALGLVLRATVHDEVVSDFPKGASLVPVVDLLNVQRVPMSVPITWKAGVGANWHEAK